VAGYTFPEVFEMADVYRDVLTWTGGGQLFANVLHFSLTESGGARPDQYAAALIDSFESVILPVWLDVVSTTVEVVSQKCQKVTGGGGPSVTKLYGPGDAAGTRAGSIGQTSENIVIEFPVLLNAKNVTGKVFVSGILDADIVDNAFGSTVKTAAEALGTSLLGTYTFAGALGDFHFVIFNRATGFFASPTFRQIGLVVGSQRRRLRA
jgi:hypothetical protein